MLKKLNLVGVIVGVLIIAFAVLIFTSDVTTATPVLEEIQLEEIGSPSSESDKYYGGDAYTGMQQAAAQAANNLIPVFGAIEANNDAISVLNANNIEAAKVQAKNIKALISLLKDGIALILVSVGLAVVAKNVEIEISFAKKKEEAQTAEAPAQTPEC